MVKIEQFGEGTANYYNTLKMQREYPNKETLNLPPIFKRYVVLDVIEDQSFFQPDKHLASIDELVRLHGRIKNVEHLVGKVAPRNSIIAKPVYISNNDNRFQAQQPEVLYPFFPSHLALPCKPGEHVWVMFESITENKSLGYWFCRIVGPDHIDDVNHSHAPREHDDSFFVLDSGLSPGSDTAPKPRYYFKNGIFRKFPVPTDDGSQISQEGLDTSAATLLSFLPVEPEEEGEFFESFTRPTQKIDPNAYENLLTAGSLASKRVTREPIPRYKKKPADMALEGSNNTLIALGVDDAFFGSSAAGLIDMVAGRGSTPATMGSIAENEIGFVGELSPGEGAVETIKGKELDKHASKLTSLEGNPDYLNDRSRILISQRAKPDTAFGLADYNSSTFTSSNTPGATDLDAQITDSPTGDAAIVIRTDKVRIIARSDIQLMVQRSAPSEDPTGTPIRESLVDTKLWASITIKGNGDIIFTPSSDGYIKLGGDDADKGIVCSALPVAKTNGGVIGDAIQNTAGGRFGGSLQATSAGNTPAIGPKHGTFANKVLVK